MNIYTYNQYLTEGIQNGSIPSREVDGVTVYSVRRPANPEYHPAGCDECKEAWYCHLATQGDRCTQKEEVIGFTSFSDNFIAETPTQRARREATD